MRGPPLLERDTHLIQLADARAAGGRVVLVAGEAGIGKTMLVEAFAESAADARLLRGSCDALFAPRPLGPLHDMARQAGGRLAAAASAPDARERGPVTWWGGAPLVVRGSTRHPPT